MICTGNGHIRLTLVALKYLELIGNDLSNENEKLLRKEKPFAMLLASQFQSVLLIDSDVLFL